MKTIKFQSSKGVFFPFVYALFLSFIMIACKKVESDQSQKASQEGGIKTVYLQANGSTLIDKMPWREQIKIPLF